MGEGQDRRRGAEHQEHRHPARSFASAGQASLLGASRRRHQGGDRRLEEEARRRSACGGEGFALRPSTGVVIMATETLSPNIAKIHLTERAALKIRALLEK